MLVAENYHKIYYQQNKGKYKSNFKNWYAKEENKKKMREYMRNYMRKKNNIKKEDFRFKK